MIEKYTLDMLNKDGVSVLKQNYTVIDGKEYAIEGLWRRAYMNSEQDRQKIELELPIAQVNAIMSVWGDTPTVNQEITGGN